MSCVDHPTGALASTKACENRSYCKAAFESLHLAIGGAAKPCCEFEGEIGNVREATPQDVWTGAPLRDLRLKMQRGERDAGCAKCYEMEDAGSESLRQIINGNGPLDIDAPVADLPKRLDIRFSNLCNLRCRTCGPDASSRWFAEAQKLDMWKTPPTALLETFGPKGSALEALAPMLDTVEHILFAGGEPLIHEEHYAVLEELIRRGRTDVHLSYISNMTELRFGRKDVLALWSKFAKVTLVASIDGHKKIGELVRDGLSWDRFTTNVSKVRTACPHVDMMFNITVSVFNIHSLPSLCQNLNEIEAAGDVPCHFNALIEPRKYNIQILPAAMKAELKRNLESFAQTFEGTRGQSTQAMAEQVQSVLNYMLFQDRSKELKRFRDHTLRLDEMREQDTAAIVPELAPVLRETFIEGRVRKAQDNARAFRRWAVKATTAKA